MYQTSLTKGQELVAQRMVREFRRLGHDAFLITSIYQDSQQAVNPEDVKRKGGYSHVFDKDLGIPVIRVGSENTSWPPRRISFVDLVGTLTEVVEDLKLNVLITHSTLWNGPEEVTKFVLWKRKMVQEGAPTSPLVFCHMSHFQEPNDERYAIVERSYRETWNNTSLRQVLLTADLILVTTPFEATFMRKLGADEGKLFLFPGGIDDEEIASSGNTAAFRAQYNLSRGMKLVSYLGSVEERKNPMDILAVARLLLKRRDIHFIIAGKAEGTYGETLIEEARDLENVSVLGAITEEEKASLIRTSFVNITMSRAESLGISQLEFMSAGVPVVTSGAGGQSWIIKDGANGIVLDGPEDVTGAAAAIARLADQPKLRARLGGAAKRTSSLYSLTRLVDRLSSRLEQEIKRFSDDLRTINGMSSDERLIEAWVHKGQRVAATSRRLIVKSVKTGREVTSVPYDDISRIVRHAEAPWALLALGVSATAGLLAQSTVGLGLFRSLSPQISATIAFLGITGFVGTLTALFPFVPALAAVSVFALTAKSGYLVHYGSSRKLFLPERFGKALRLADKLTPRDLFKAEARAADGKPSESGSRSQVLR